MLLCFSSALLCHAGGFPQAALHAYGVSLGWTLGRATLHCTLVLPESYLMPKGLGRCARRVIQPLLHCTSVLSGASCRKALGGGTPTHGRWSDASCRKALGGARNYQHLQGCVPFVGGLIPAWDARQARILGPSGECNRVKLCSNLVGYPRPLAHTPPPLLACLLSVVCCVVRALLKMGLRRVST